MPLCAVVSFGPVVLAVCVAVCVVVCEGLVLSEDLTAFKEDDVARA